MDAKKCDRCGSYYEEIEPNIIQELSSCFTVLSNAEIVRRKIENEVDLCPKCSGELKKWLKNGDINE